VPCQTGIESYIDISSLLPVGNYIIVAKLRDQ